MTIGASPPTTATMTVPGQPSEPSNGTEKTRVTIMLKFDLPAGLQVSGPGSFSCDVSNDAFSGGAATNTAVSNVSVEISLTPSSADPVGNTQNLVTPKVEVGGEDTSVKALPNFGAVNQVKGEDKNRSGRKGQRSNNQHAILPTFKKSSNTEVLLDLLKGRGTNKTPVGKGRTNAATLINESTKAASPDRHTFGCNTAASFGPVLSTDVKPSSLCKNDASPDLYQSTSIFTNEQNQRQTTNPKSSGNIFALVQGTPSHPIESSKSFFGINTNSHLDSGCLTLHKTPNTQAVCGFNLTPFGSESNKSFFGTNTNLVSTIPSATCNFEYKAPTAQANSGFNLTPSGSESTKSMFGANTNSMTRVPLAACNFGSTFEYKAPTTQAVSGLTLNLGGTEPTKSVAPSDFGCLTLYKTTNTQAVSGFALTPSGSESNKSLFGTNLVSKASCNFCNRTKYKAPTTQAVSVFALTPSGSESNKSLFDTNTNLVSKASCNFCNRSKYKAPTTQSISGLTLNLGGSESTNSIFGTNTNSAMTPSASFNFADDEKQKRLIRVEHFNSAMPKEASGLSYTPGGSGSINPNISQPVSGGLFGKPIGYAKPQNTFSRDVYGSGNDDSTIFGYSMVCTPREQSISFGSHAKTPIAKSLAFGSGGTNVTLAGANLFNNQQTSSVNPENNCLYDFGTPSVPVLPQIPNPKESDDKEMPVCRKFKISKYRNAFE